MREYEFTIITRADLQDNEREELLGKYEALLYGSGELIKKEDWGSKKLCFPIKKKYRGHYVHYDFAAADNAANLAEAERLLRIDDQILRYMLMKTNDKVNVEARKEALAKVETQKQATK